jgi:hypothetical protein
MLRFQNKCNKFSLVFIQKVHNSVSLSPHLYRNELTGKIICNITKDTKLQNFQFKLLHIILPVNSFLYKCGLKETELCTFCMETKENLLHLFIIF